MSFPVNAWLLCIYMQLIYPRSLLPQVTHKTLIILKKMPSSSSSSSGSLPLFKQEQLCNSENKKAAMIDLERMRERHRRASLEASSDDVMVNRRGVRRTRPPPPPHPRRVEDRAKNVTTAHVEANGQSV
ncbi:MAG: hypothetical protein CMI26_06930 [Opitutae bacterium]|nr:hypothetical protein [Opitutae bacterium]